MSVLGTMTQPKNITDRGNKVPTFLLVPGFSGNHATMSNLGEKIETANVVHAPDFPNLNTASLEESADILGDQIETLKDTH